MGISLGSVLGGAAKQVVKERDDDRRNRLELEKQQQLESQRNANMLRMLEVKEGLSRETTRINREESMAIFLAGTGGSTQPTPTVGIPQGTPKSVKRGENPLPGKSTGGEDKPVVESILDTYDRAPDFGAKGIMGFYDEKNPAAGRQAYDDHLDEIRIENQEHNRQNRQILSEFGEQGLKEFRDGRYGTYDNFAKGRGEELRIAKVYGDEAYTNLMDYKEKNGSIEGWAEAGGSIYLTQEEAALNQRYNNNRTADQVQVRPSYNGVPTAEFRKMFKGSTDLQVYDTSADGSQWLGMGEQPRGLYGAATSSLQGVASSFALMTQNKNGLETGDAASYGSASVGDFQTNLQEHMNSLKERGTGVKGIEGSKALNSYLTGSTDIVNMNRKAELINMGTELLHDKEAYTEFRRSISPLLTTEQRVQLDNEIKINKGKEVLARTAEDGLKEYKNAIHNSSFYDKDEKAAILEAIGEKLKAKEEGRLNEEAKQMPNITEELREGTMDGNDLQTTSKDSSDFKPTKSEPKEEIIKEEGTQTEGESKFPGWMPDRPLSPEGMKQLSSQVAETFTMGDERLSKYEEDKAKGELVNIFGGKMEESAYMESLKAAKEDPYSVVNIIKTIPDIGEGMDNLDIWSDLYQGTGDVLKEAQFLINSSRFSNGQAPEEENITKFSEMATDAFLGDFKEVLPEKDRGDIVKLMKQTAYHESLGGKYDEQQGGGPAKGWWQVEPETARDLLKNSALIGPKAEAMAGYSKEELAAMDEEAFNELLKNPAVNAMFAAAKYATALTHEKQQRA